MFVTPAEVASYLAIPFDAANVKFAADVATANEIVSTYCSRPFEYGTHTEIVRGLGGPLAFTSEAIVSISDIRSDSHGQFLIDSVIALSEIVFTGNEIRWLYSGFPRSTGGVKITYVGGYRLYTEPVLLPKLPAAVFRTTCEVAAQLYKRSAGAERFASESIGGDYSYTRAATEWAVDESVLAAVDQYRRYHV